MQDVSSAAMLAPTGRLRAVINLGNRVLAHRDDETGELSGVTVDLARALADELGVPLDLHPVIKTPAAVEAISQEAVDVGFCAIDPKRAAGIVFSPAYVLIEGGYLVREDSPLRANEEVDRPETRVVVGQGSAYDLFLTRHLQQATLVRTATSQQVVDEFLAGGHDVAAGVRQQLQADAQRVGGARLLPGRFMVIEQAMGIPASRPAAAVTALAHYIERQKKSGFIADALARHGIQGASVAP